VTDEVLVVDAVIDGVWEPEPVPLEVCVLDCVSEGVTDDVCMS